MDRRTTAWKKSRKFGDVYGGRRSVKVPDRIFNRAHSLPALTADDEKPVFIVDNPSRDFIFPLTAKEIKAELVRLPDRDWSTITHIWLRRFRKRDYEKGELPLAEFICGSGVRLIVLYPWPADLRYFLSTKKPTTESLKLFEGYETSLAKTDSGWWLEFELPVLKEFYVQTLLYHEIGHNVDWYQRHWTDANQKAQEEYADQYAYERTTKRASRY